MSAGCSVNSFYECDVLNLHNASVITPLMTKISMNVNNLISSWSLLALFNLILNISYKSPCKGNKSSCSLRISLKVLLCLT